MKCSIIFVLILFSFYSFINAAKIDFFSNYNKALIFNHIIPRYKIFYESSNSLVKSTKNLCDKNINNNKLRLVQNYFHNALDAWMNISHISFGPIETNARSNRIFFWPDKHNTGVKHLNRLIIKKDKKNYHNDNFKKLSVAVQGFPALEKLLFSESEWLFYKNENAEYRCHLIQTISKNIKLISFSIFQEWTIKYKDIFVNKTLSSHSVYTGDKQFFFQFHKSLINSLQYISNLKLGRPLGKGFNNVKPKRSESWRTQRSFRNIIINLKALESLFFGKNNYNLSEFILKNNDGYSKSINAIKIKLNETIKLADSFKHPLNIEIQDKVKYMKIKKLKNNLDDLIEIINYVFIKSLNISHGFNAFDGD